MAITEKCSQAFVENKLNCSIDIYLLEFRSDKGELN